MDTTVVAGQSVLVVDDERSIADLLADLLEEEGYRVRPAYDGVAALAAVDRAVPDLVIADVAMPRLDGLALAKRLRERGIPVILMSAAAPAPADSTITFIAKPFDLDHLLTVVARVLVRN